jgi:hypothetical protein
MLMQLPDVPEIFNDGSIIRSPEYPAPNLSAVLFMNVEARVFSRAHILIHNGICLSTVVVPDKMQPVINAS